jgi:uncharacterized protein YjbI with pentapeptide repeats
MWTRTGPALDRERRYFMDDKQQQTSTEIWNRLTHRLAIDELALPIKNGRLDLRFLHIVETHAIGSAQRRVAAIRALGGLTEIRGADWKSIDFSSGQLSGLRFFDCNVTDCVFDECRCHDWRVWGSVFTKTSFRAANLRGAVLGGVINQRRNEFHQVDFTSADLRESVYSAAEFLGCRFENTKLDKIDFQTSVFADCVFVGELREVVFHNIGFKGERYPENKMTRVDFRRAKLRWVEFRGLELTEIYPPEDNDHIIIKNYQEALDRLCRFFSGHPDSSSKKLVGLFANCRKHVPNRRAIGILNKNDLVDIAGREGLQAVLRIIEGVEAGT